MKNINWQRIRPAVGVEPFVGFDLGGGEGASRGSNFVAATDVHLRPFLLLSLSSRTLISFDFFPSAPSSLSNFEDLCANMA